MTDLQFITTPSKWPRWPVMPVVKRQSNGFECGLVFADGKPIVILDANIFGLSVTKEPTTWGEVLAPYKRQTYNSFQELLVEWRID